jgi:hypothetical protein
MNTDGWRKKSLRRGPRLVLKKLLNGHWVFRSLGRYVALRLERWLSIG